MQILLPDNHPSLSMSFQVREMLKSSFPNSPLTFFQYKKVHLDGNISMISNRPDWTKASFNLNNRKVYSCTKKEYLDKNSYWFLWDHNLFDAPLAIARNEFNIANGICFLERQLDCYYLMAFATNKSLENALDYYLNRLESLKCFILLFRNNQTALLNQLDLNRIILSKESQDPNKDILFLNRKNKRIRIPVIFNKFKGYITPQEYECIKGLPSGKTSKDIAMDLKISYRTVEGYFSRVMARIGCRTKQDLITLLCQIEDEFS